MRQLNCGGYKMLGKNKLIWWYQFRKNEYETHHCRAMQINVVDWNDTNNQDALHVDNFKVTNLKIYD